jgi:hypothetical protein
MRLKEIVCADVECIQEAEDSVRCRAVGGRNIVSWRQRQRAPAATLRRHIANKVELWAQE